MPASRVQRADFYNALELPAVMGNGSLRVQGRATRSGIYVYQNDDGTLRREYRPPDEVFDGSSMDSLRGAPMTLGHPPDMVDPDNYADHAVGTILGVARSWADGGDDAIKIDAVITRRDALDALAARQSTQLSGGYSCLYDATPGTTPDGLAYDGTQSSIAYNHVAMVDVARGGPDMKLRTDAAPRGTPIEFIACASKRTDSTDMKPASTARKESTMPKIRIDGLELDVTDATAAVIQQKIDALTQRADKADADAKTAKADAEKAQGRADAAVESEKASKAGMAAAVQARVALERNAQKILGAEVKLDGMSDLDVMKAVVVKRSPAVKLDGVSDERIIGRYEVAIETAPESRADENGPNGRAAFLRGTAADSRSDAGTEDLVEKARKEHEARMDSMGRPQARA